MSFLLFALIAIGALGLLAALLSIGDSDSPVVHGDHDCASCTSHDDGSCKIACMMEESRRRKEEKVRVAASAETDGDDGDDGNCVTDVHSDESDEDTDDASDDRPSATDRLPLTPIILLLAILVAASCSTQQNNSQTRMWHAFNARYNTYFNASQAFIEGCDEQERGNQDDYTQLLPIYAVGNKQSRSIGTSHFDRTIEKSEKAIRRHSIKRRPEWNKQRRKTKADIEWLNRHEYNPFLWRAWLLLGKAQFHEGNFEESAATFGYMARLYKTQPIILARARAWQAKCYAEMGWRYETEDLITNQRRDSIPRQAVADWDFTLADHYLRTGQYADATRYLMRCIRHERRRQRKARLWYIVGQIEQHQGHSQQAFEAYRHVVRLQPPYELEFNARISQTEVMASTDAKGMIRKLQRMAASDNNKDYLDQIHYAIGNIRLAQRDTLQAIASYEEGARRSTRNGTEKGALLLQLAQLYWQREAYANARRCYSEAVGLIDTALPYYKEVNRRSEILDQLVPLTDAVHLEDSLQRLAAMPEADRLKVIDRHIAELKNAEREAKRAQQDAEMQSQWETQNAQNNGMSAVGNDTKASTWYFYNPQLVSQGRIRFEQLWGKRPNEDDWQRSNRSVVPTLNGEADHETEVDADSAKTIVSATGTESDTTQLNPFTREYHLTQLPFTAEQKAESDRKMRQALLPAAVIMKDKVENLALARRMFTYLVDRWPTDSLNDLAWYHLYLMNAREGRMADADSALVRLQRQYPQSEWTKLLSNPYYADNQRFGQHLEDSLYAATYEAFCQERYQEVAANVQLSAQRFPHGAHRSKFLFVEALSLLNEGRVDKSAQQLKQVVEDYPDSEVGPMAGHILRGLQQGRRPQGTMRPKDDIWRQHTLAESSDSTVADTLSLRRDVRFAFVLAFHPDSVNQNQLLYELARYNFTSYLVRNFEIAVNSEDPVHRLTISGFRSYDEALQYARHLYEAPQMTVRLKGCRRIIISEDNLPLLGTQYSYDDYDRFFQETLAPVKTDSHPLLNSPETIVEQSTDHETDDDADEDQLPMPSSSPDQPIVIDFDDDFYR